MAQIAIRLGDLKAAGRIVEDLKRHGFTADYYHRRAHLLLQEGQPEDALAAARAAVQENPRRFESYALESEALIALGRLDEARSKLDHLPVRSGRDADLKSGLLCRLDLRFNADWRAADLRWRTIARNDSTLYTRVRLEILDSALRDPGLDLSARAAYERERSALLSKGIDLDDLQLEVQSGT